MEVLSPQIAGIIDSIPRIQQQDTILRPPFVISNDANVVAQMPRLAENAKQWKDGYALLIGSGGLLSLLPELQKLSFILVVDRDKRVLDFHKDMVGLVQSCGSPTEVQAALSSLYQDRVKRLSDKVHYEGYQYGDYHWTDPKRFQLVKDALLSHAIHFIHQDITAEELAKSLRDLEASGMPLRFANLTNVHVHLDNSGCLRRLPISPDTSVMFSEHDDVHGGTYPTAQLVKGIDAYFQRLAEMNTV